MASEGFCPYCSPYRNLFPINHLEDELARDPSLAKGFHLDNTSLAPFCDSTLGLALVPALISALVLALAPVLLFFDELFKQFMKAYLESN